MRRHPALSKPSGAPVWKLKRALSLIGFQLSASVLWMRVSRPGLYAETNQKFTPTAPPTTAGSRTASRDLARELRLHRIELCHRHALALLATSEVIQPENTGTGLVDRELIELRRMLEALINRLALPPTRSDFRLSGYDKLSAFSVVCFQLPTSVLNQASQGSRVSTPRQHQNSLAPRPLLYKYSINDDPRRQPNSPYVPDYHRGDRENLRESISRLIAG